MDRLARRSSLSGLAFAVLFGIGSGIWVLDQPQRGADTSELVAFYSETSTAILVGGTLSLFSLPCLAWFGPVLRERIAAAEGAARTGLPLVAFGGALLTACVGQAVETINMAGR